jgi:hypothetical protein
MNLTFEGASYGEQLAVGGGQLAIFKCKRMTDCPLQTVYCQLLILLIFVGKIFAFYIADVLLNSSINLFV